MIIKKLILSVFVLFPISQSLGQVGVYTGETIEDIKELVEYRKDEIWAVTGSYIYKFENGGNQVTLFDNSTFFDDPGIIHTLNIGKDSLWMGSDSGIYNFDGQNWNKLQLNGLPGPVTEIKFTIDHRMWFISDGHLYSWDGNILKDEIYSGNTLATFQTQLFLGNATSLTTAKVYFNGTWTNLANASFKTNVINDLEVDGLGNLWAANNNGISYYDGSSWIDLHLVNGGSSKLLIRNNKAIASIKLDYSPTDNDGNLISISAAGVKDTFYYPTQETNNPSVQLANGFNGSILLAKSSPKKIFRYFPSLRKGKIFLGLNKNKLSAGISSNGQLFRDIEGSYGEQGLRADNRLAIYTSGLWLSGKDDNNLEHISANKFYQGTDFFSGPISNIYDSLYISKYNRVWKVSQDQIKTHKLDYANAGYTMPEVIRNWPGNGDQSKGEGKYLAPFIDRNFNEVYEPELGDYPDILGDEAIFSISNDSRGPKRNTWSPSMKMEVHTMIYIYDSLSFKPLHNTVFVRYKTINRSSHNYKDFKLGVWIDPDIGNSGDDLIGCDSIENIFFAYNADADDDGPFGYGLFPPAVGGLFLSDKMSGFSYRAHGGGILPNASVGDPETVLEYYQSMNGEWRDGSSLKLENPSGFMNANGTNGDGWDPSGNFPNTRFAYNAAANWYNFHASFVDSRILPILDIGNLSSGEKACIDFALIYARDEVNPQLDASLNLFKSYADSIKSFYSKQLYVCLGESIGVEEDLGIENESIDLYPNPVLRGSILNIKVKTAIKKLSLYDSQGKQVFTRIGSFKDKIELIVPTHLNSGLYLIILETNSGETQAAKLSIE